MTDLLPAFEWAVVLDIYERPVFDVASTRELFLAVGPPPNAAEKAERAAFWLQELAKGFAFNLWRESQPSVSDQEAEALRLAAACGHVLSLVGIGDHEPSPDRLLPMFGPGGLYAAAAIRGESSGKAATMNALRGVYLLREDALKMVEIFRKRPRRKGRPEGKAIKQLVASLSHLYVDIWDAAPAVSRAKAGGAYTGNEPIGPLVRLMREVTSALRARGLRFAATDESLAKQWERLPADERLRFGIDKNGGLKA